MSAARSEETSPVVPTAPFTPRMVAAVDQLVSAIEVLPFVDQVALRRVLGTTPGLPPPMEIIMRCLGRLISAIGEDMLEAGRG